MIKRISNHFRADRSASLAGLLLCLSLATLVAVSGCGKKGADGAGPGTEITGDTGSTTDPSGGGSSIPGAGESPGDATGAGSRVEDIFFDYDRYALREEARQVLQENARYLMNNPNTRVVLEGHCDERGTNEYNLALGQRRADAVLEYLVNLGVPASRLSTVSFGEEKPFAMGSSEASWAENRRVHFDLR